MTVRYATTIFELGKVYHSEQSFAVALQLYRNSSEVFISQLNGELGQEYFEKVQDQIKLLERDEEKKATSSSIGVAGSNEKYKMMMFERYQKSNQFNPSP